MQISTKYCCFANKKHHQPDYEHQHAAQSRDMVVLSFEKVLGIEKTGSVILLNTSKHLVITSRNGQVILVRFLIPILCKKKKKNSSNSLTLPTLKKLFDLSIQIGKLAQKYHQSNVVIHSVNGNNQQNTRTQTLGQKCQLGMHCAHNGSI